MDVTSLLNANSIAVDQQRKEENETEEKKRGTPTKAPSRNRTPWDAGGYSLPINTISNPTTSPRTEVVEHRESQSTPTSPRHKYSDSRSSLSSFTSPLQSASHSRFSSLSTVGSAYPSNHPSEAHSSISGQKPHALDFSHSSNMEGIQSIYPQPGGSLSPTQSLDALALVAENEMAGQQARQLAETSNSEWKTDTVYPEKIESGPGPRPSSPSDAILIKRASVMPSLRGDQELNGMDRSFSHRHYLTAPLEAHHQTLVTRSHKRALSVPNFPASMAGLTMSDTSSMGPWSQPTPPSSLHPDRNSPTIIPSSYAAPATPPQMHGEGSASDHILCMYIPNCDTGSQLRKAISHIFGRNKMCTRLIPARVWVHYCRKHYQRSRYRNPKEYAKLQCDLVQTQIRRVHEWSVDNASRGLPGVVQDWGLAVRKREQKRLDEMNGSKKRNMATAFENSDDEDAPEVNSRASNILPLTAVPQWLLRQCGKGYSTQAILQIFNRLHTEILDDTLSCFPDIEILPNIVVDSDEPKSPKGYAKRTVVSGGHKRAQSLGVAAMRPDSQPQNRRLSHPDVWGVGQRNSLSPVQKKRRANGSMTEAEEYALYSRSHLAERPLQRGSGQMVHRPAFPGINEDGVEERFPNMVYGQAPLPAPTPQRSGGQSMAAHLEMNNVRGPSRPVHQRSQSDMGAFAYGREYSPSTSSSSVYGSQAGHYGHSSYDQGYSSRRPESSHETRLDSMPQHFARRSDISHDGRFNEMPQHYSHVSNHGRHQTMSMVPSASMYQHSAYYSQQPVPQYQSSPASLSRTRIVETQEAHDAFASRR